MKKLILIMTLLVSAQVFALDGFGHDQNELNADIQSGADVLLVFGASWCGPCQQMKRNVWTTQSFLNFADQLGVEKYYFDTDANQALMTRWGVSTIPTWFTIRDNKISSKNGPSSNNEVMNVMQRDFQ